MMEKNWQLTKLDEDFSMKMVSKGVIDQPSVRPQFWKNWLYLYKQTDPGEFSWYFFPHRLTGSRSARIWWTRCEKTPPRWYMVEMFCEGSETGSGKSPGSLGGCTLKEPGDESGFWFESMWIWTGNWDHVKKTTPLDISLWELFQNTIVLERENFKITYPQLAFWSFLVLKRLHFDKVLTAKCQWV